MQEAKPAVLEANAKTLSGPSFKKEIDPIMSHITWRSSLQYFYLLLSVSVLRIFTESENPLKWSSRVFVRASAYFSGKRDHNLLQVCREILIQICTHKYSEPQRSCVHVYPNIQQTSLRAVFPPLSVARVVGLLLATLGVSFLLQQ